MIGGAGVRKKTVDDYVVDTLAYVFVIFAALITIYPFLYTLSASISDPIAVIRGEVFIWPVGLSLDAYGKIFTSAEIWVYYYNTVWYTVIGTVLNVLFTALAAYPLSRRHFFGKRFFTVYVTIPMFFSGGLIPLFILVTKIGLYNQRMAMVLPGLIAVWNLIICRTFFQSIPEELTDSAKIDGCSPIRTLFSIVMPLSKAVLAVLVIYYGIGHWNSFIDALIFLPDARLHPIQIYLRRVLIQASPELMAKLGQSMGNRPLSVFQVKYAVAMVVIGPIILIYPFLQKYFVKGVMIGSLKG
jgi:putative aldouronate transport system permease protein